MGGASGGHVPVMADPFFADTGGDRDLLVLFNGGALYSSTRRVLGIRFNLGSPPTPEHFEANNVDPGKVRVELTSTSTQRNKR